MLTEWCSICVANPVDLFGDICDYCVNSYCPSCWEWWDDCVCWMERDEC